MRTRMKDIGVQGFCHTYGLLIVQIWEDSMYQLKDWYHSNDAVCFNARVAATRGDDDTSENHSIIPSTAGSTEPHLEQPVPEEHTDGSTLQSSGADCSGYPSGGTFQTLDGFMLSSPTSGASVSPPRTRNVIRRPRWQPEEDNYLQSLMELSLEHKVAAERLEEKFGSGRSEASVGCRVRHLYQVKGVNSRNNKDWTSDEKQCLESLLKTEKDWNEVYVKYQAKYGKDRTLKSLQMAAVKRKLATGFADRNIWTDEQLEYLQSLRQENMSYAECARLLNQEFRVERTVQSVGQKVRALSGERSTHDFWRQDELDYLWNLMSSKLGRADVVAAFWKQFGSERSSHAISKKIHRLEANGGPTAQLNLWTAEEDVFIRNNLQSTRDELFRAFQARFGNSRTRQMVYKRKERLGQYLASDK